MQIWIQVTLNYYHKLKVNMILISRYQHLVCAISVILAAFPLAAFSLPEDTKEKLHIKADNTIYNYKNGLNYFEGHVQIDQGSTHVTADRLTTKANDKHQIQEAIAYGVTELAHFWTVPKAGELVINAHAKIIKFYPITSNATLQGEVFVTQGENNFQEIGRAH